MIESGIYGLFIGNNLVILIRGLKPIQLYPLDQGEVVTSARLESWIRTWLGETLISLSAKYWFENKGDNLLWSLPLDVAEK